MSGRLTPAETAAIDAAEDAAEWYSRGDRPVRTDHAVRDLLEDTE